MNPFAAIIIQLLLNYNIISFVENINYTTINFLTITWILELFKKINANRYPKKTLW